MRSLEGAAPIPEDVPLASSMRQRNDSQDRRRVSEGTCSHLDGYATIYRTQLDRNPSFPSILSLKLNFIWGKNETIHCKCHGGPELPCAVEQTSTICPSTPENYKSPKSGFLNQAAVGEDASVVTCPTPWGGSSMQI